MVFIGNRVYQRTDLKAAAPLADLIVGGGAATVPAREPSVLGGGDCGHRHQPARRWRRRPRRRPPRPAIGGEPRNAGTDDDDGAARGTGSRSCRRPISISGSWIDFDYSSFPKRDKTKSAGSYAISPIVIERLALGALTGSIHQWAIETVEGVATTHYKMNVSCDKAERHLSDKQRQDLDKMFRANAIGGQVFAAEAWVDSTGTLRRSPCGCARR